MKADFARPLTLPDYQALGADDRKAYDRAFAVEMIRHRFGDERATESTVEPFDRLMVLATGVADPGVGRTILMKIYESEAAARIPDWEPVYC